MLLIIPLPILGALLGAGISGLFNVGSTIAANKFNAPKAQLKRLRKAGLPQAYMYGGRVSTQTQIPDLDIDPDLGFAEAGAQDIGQQKVDISEKDMLIRLQKLGIDISKLDLDWAKYGISQEELGIKKEQLDINKSKLGIQEEQLGLQKMLTDEQLNKLKAEVDLITSKGKVAAGEAKWLSALGDDGKTNQERNLALQQSIAKADLFLKQNQGAIAEIQAGVDKILADAGVPLREKEVQIELMAQRITNLMSQDKLLGQLSNIREVQEKVSEILMDNMKEAARKNEPIGELGLLIYSLFLKML